ncbi:MAG: hypothetical protein HRF49_07580 [bacterium]|jgi:hypothetical protein
MAKLEKPGYNRPMAKCLSIAALLFLAACGGGSPAPVNPPEIPAITLHNRTGDSLFVEVRVPSEPDPHNFVTVGSISPKGTIKYYPKEWGEFSFRITTLVGRIILHLSPGQSAEVP